MTPKVETERDAYLRSMTPEQGACLGKLYAETGIEVDSLPGTPHMENLLKSYNTHGKCKQHPLTAALAHKVLVKFRKDGVLIRTRDLRPKRRESDLFPGQPNGS